MERLSDEAFAAFMEGLDSEDRQEFFYTFAGNERQMRFVACIDMLMISGVAEGGNKGSIQAAYMMATGSTKEVAEKKAYDDFHHPAVQAIISRLKYRTRSLVWTTIEMEYAALIKKQLQKANEDDSSLKERELAIKAGYMFSQTVNREEVQQRNERTKLGMARARGAAELAGGVPDEAKVKALIVELRKHYGPELDRIIAESSSAKKLNP
jgi:hypothetical protein